MNADLAGVTAPAMMRGREAMNVKVPHFIDTDCVNLTLCSVVEKPSSGVLALLGDAARRELICKRRAGREMLFWRVLLSKVKRGFHFHMDFTAPEAFLYRKPTVNAKSSDLIDLVAVLEGATLDSFVNGTFWIDRDHAPPFMVSSLASATVGQLTVRMNQAGMTINGGPISTAEWEDYEKFLSIKVGVEKKMIFNDATVVDALKQLREGLGSLTAGALK